MYYCFLYIYVLCLVLIMFFPKHLLFLQMINDAKLHLIYDKMKKQRR